MTQKLTQALKQIGLTNTEIKVYLTLLDLGQSLAGSIATKANLYRKNVYDALSTLLKKGLVTCVVKSNRKYWNPINPKAINSIIDEKTQIIRSIMPDLVKRFKTSNIKKNIIIFEDIKGMKNFYYDMLEQKQSIQILGATGKAYSKLKYFIHPWTKKINKSNIRFKVLWNHDAVNKNMFTKKIKKTTSRTLPKNISTPTQIFIYGNKSAIVIWSQEPTAILIENKEITKGFKQYFEFMWNLSRK